MTLTRRTVVLGAVCMAAASVAPGLLFLHMRAGVPSPALRRGPVNPLLSLPRVRLGGSVRDVLAHAGDSVKAGQVLVRLESDDLEMRLLHLRRASEAIEKTLQSGEAIAKLPPQARQYLYELHPDTLRAEQDYSAALEASERASVTDRDSAREQLQRAAAERVRVRRNLGHLLSGGSATAEWRPALAEIGRAIAELEKLLVDAEVRAPESGTIDVLEVQPGQKLAAGQPVAVLVSSGEYSMELRVGPAELARLHPGMLLRGRMDEGGARIEARVESIAMRKLPVIARENLQVAEEPALRVRIRSAQPLRIGAMATLEFP